MRIDVKGNSHVNVNSDSRFRELQFSRNVNSDSHICEFSFSLCETQFIPISFHRNFVNSVSHFVKPNSHPIHVVSTGTFSTCEFSFSLCETQFTLSAQAFTDLWIQFLTLWIRFLTLWNTIHGQDHVCTDTWETHFSKREFGFTFTWWEWEFEFSVKFQAHSTVPGENWV